MAVRLSADPPPPTHYPPPLGPFNLPGHDAGIDSVAHQGRRLATELLGQDQAEHVEALQQHEHDSAAAPHPGACFPTE